MTPEDTDIAIVGGGICGLTTAIALERRGFSPTVYEAASAYRPIGAGILLQTNALLVLDRLGLADRVRRAGVPLTDSVIRSSTGRVLQRFDVDRVERAEFGYGFVAIHRADLQRILLNELRTDVQTGMGCETVTAVDPPSVSFAEGTRIQPDILIGADGINSTVRDAVAPNTAPRTFDGLVYRAIASVPLPAAFQSQGVEVWGEGTYSGGAPIGDDRYYWFATAADPGTTATSSPQPSSSFVAQLASFPEPIPTVVESLTDDDIFCTGLADLPPLDRWHRDATVLAGDAAHAMLPFAGQGAAQAIEDGLALAHSIDTHDEWDAAVQAYQQVRKPRADRIRAESHGLGRLGTIQSRFGSRCRNVAVSLLPESLFRRSRRRRAATTSLPEAR